MVDNRRYPRARIDFGSGIGVPKESEEKRRWGTLVDAIEAGVVGAGYAGRWTDDNGGYVVATSGDLTAVEEALAVACPQLDVRVVSAQRSLVELDALVERVTARADTLDTELSSAG